jgi:hypothetical protein
MDAINNAHIPYSAKNSNSNSAAGAAAEAAGLEFRVVRNLVEPLGGQGLGSIKQWRDFGSSRYPRAGLVRFDTLSPLTGAAPVGTHMISIITRRANSIYALTHVKQAAA